MPRVNRQTKNRAGKVVKCGKCGKTIEPGEVYLKWSFRYGGTYYRCAAHPPRRSDLTQSKLGGIYAAIEAAEDALPTASTSEEIRDLIADVAEVANEVAAEYDEAAEMFGGEGENAERAEEVRDFSYELEAFYPEPADDAEELAEIRSEAEALLSEAGI